MYARLGCETVCIRIYIAHTHTKAHTHTPTHTFFKSDSSGVCVEAWPTCAKESNKSRARPKRRKLLSVYIYILVFFMQKGVLFMQRELGQLLNFNLVRLSKQQVRKGDRESEGERKRDREHEKNVASRQLL